MHETNSPQNPSRSRRRRALEALAIVAGTYGAFQMVQQIRARRQSAGDVSLPPVSPMISSPMMSSPMLSPAASPSLGEHSQWLESFRTEQVRRLRSDPPAA